jgi:hypothetical protein
LEEVWRRRRIAEQVLAEERRGRHRKKWSSKRDTEMEMAEEGMEQWKAWWRKSPYRSSGAEKIGQEKEHRRAGRRKMEEDETEHRRG